MQTGFPIALLPLVRCSVDDGELRPGVPAAGPFVDHGHARCDRCGRLHPIRNGILSLLDARSLHPESVTEMHARDQRNESILSGTRDEWRSRFTDAIEVRPTLDAVDAMAGAAICELGCGPGRYTLALAERSRVVAVDFSLPGLSVLKQKLAPSAAVALVQADVTRPYAVPNGFDRVLSTLHSNLPGADQRQASLALIARSLKASGRAVVSMHHYSMRDRLTAAPASGRYPENGIYYCAMTTAESRREAAPFFHDVRHKHIGVSVPGVHSVAVAHLAARVPLMRSSLGRLFLAVCERPRDVTPPSDQPAAESLPRARDGVVS